MDDLSSSSLDPAEQQPTRRLSQDGADTRETLGSVPATTAIPASHATTAVLQQLKGADHPNDVARQLSRWHQAMTSAQPLARYALLGQLGAGAQGIVYRVIDRDCRREVAFKSVRAADADPHDLSRFVHEAQVTAQLEHPGIIPVHDFGTLPDGTVFFSMKKVEGQNLAEWLVERKGRIEQRFDLLQVFMRICEAVGFAHSRSVVHRDLKPRNIMVGRFGEVLVMDWGLAKIAGVADPTQAVTSLRSEDTSDADIHRTIRGFAVGTPAYMSPEQARGEADQVDARSDIYSLGVILYEMLDGGSPYVRGDVRRTLSQVADGRVRRLDQPRLGEGGRLLAAIVAKAMAHRREERYGAAEDLLRDLRSFLAGQAVSVYRESSFEISRRWLRQRRKAAAVVAGVTLVLGLAVTGWRLQIAWREAGELARWRDEAGSAIIAGDFAGARSRYERILTLRPHDSEASERLVATEAAIKRLRDEEEQTRRHEGAATLRREAGDLLAQGDEGLRLAIERYMQAMGLTPGDESLVREYSAAVQRLGAVEVEQRSAALAEDRQRRADALLRESMASRDAGRLEAAVTQAEAALHLQATEEGRSLLRDLDQALADERRLQTQAKRRSEGDGAAIEVRKALAESRSEDAARLLERLHGIDATHPELTALTDAVALAEQARRNLDAERLLDQALGLVREADSLAREVDELRHTVHRREDELTEHGNPEARGVLRELEVRLDDVARRRSADLAEAVALLHRAHSTAPGHPTVAAALADFFVARLLEAERAGDGAQAEAAAAQARVFDDGSRSRVLDGLAHLRLAAGSRPCTVQRIVQGPDRCDALASDPAQPMVAGEGQDLHAGRYLIRNDRGVVVARRLARGDDRTLFLGEPPSVPPGMVYVAGGPVFAEDGRVLRELPAFAIGSHEVTCGEYLLFLNDPATRRTIGERLKDGELVYAPRDSLSATAPLWRQRGIPGRAGAGTFALELGDGSAIDPTLPVTLISYDDALAYATWKAQQEDQPWRLPTRDEWLLAVQSGDGRAYPWGCNADPSLCYSWVAAQRLGARDLLAGGTFISDHSLAGCLDLAGSLSEFVLDAAADPSLGVVVGGNRYDRQAERFTVWSRRELMRRLPSSTCGLRMALDLR